MAFEEEFGIEIPDDAAEKIQTVGDADQVHQRERQVLSPFRSARRQADDATSRRNRAWAW